VFRGREATELGTTRFEIAREDARPRRLTSCTYLFDLAFEDEQVILETKWRAGATTPLITNVVKGHATTATAGAELKRWL
jgi:hypothetical protein